ncbi:MAG: hypothetical protein ACTSX7_01870 [Alphaproteobacteria bacterium]
MSRVTEGLDLKPGPRTPSLGDTPVDTYTLPRSSSPGRLSLSSRHRAQQYHARLLGEIRRHESQGGPDTRRSFDQLQAARRELFRIERELGR